MKTKDKFLVGFLSVITLGLIWIYWKKAAKPTQHNQLSQSTKIPFNLNELISLLGNKENITKVENSHKKIKIYLNNTKNLELQKIQSLKGISGVLASSNYINLIVGNNAEYLKQQIENIIK
ncbi:PTS glucose transporter subunit IIB [Mycoplasma procyoni]|uniref:PTS glucose transporter subunit IIB n=1 Tax=Mycoplasma procyoni TaxID=568784 RepID=UPI00197B92EA|nr:PTS glucose transporter subunit IIB [Mycoplasma procyoni]MBN3534563.1 PTS glucose transporter subunit IIB [Mycoplasma procyoni]